MSFSDETLMAYADGELDEPARTEVERAMRGDPALAARVAQHQAMRSDVFAAFAPIADEPLPPALLATAMPDKVSDLGAARAARSQPQRRWAWQEWGAIAASLSVGVLVGSLVLGGGSGAGASAAARLLVAQDADGAALAHGRLAAALSNQLASTGAGQAAAAAAAAGVGAQAAGNGAPGADGGAIRIGVTFAATDGALCRSFIAGSAAGLACRSGDQWKLAVLAEAEQGASGDYRQAGSAMPPAVLEAIDARIAGPALDAQAEKAAQQRGWR
ncbi:hypothetical protein ASD15_17035 [Massilia sp. Root351]|jgi:anti-sigma factor RsiW|uniref:anti-sigma factor family protein n=1 Tax=Massilia sp. Root351 TaxID=1736522 RepID=UPI000708CA62|nr:hypothetical protein [Massilia sp. Root351]KQV79740.1 hypothetical protein ASD15_17035 [Massilia sp. Root351]